MNENLKEIFGKKIQSTLEGLSNNKIQDILEEMNMLDENGYCPHTAEEIFRAGVEWTFEKIFGWTLDDVDFNEEYEFNGIAEPRETKGTLKRLIDGIEKPKFKVGEWLVDNCGNIWKIEGILNQFYILEGVEGGESRPTIEWVDKTFHLWSINNVKDGDILVSMWKGHQYIYIFKNIESNAIISHIYYYPELNAIDMGVINMNNIPTVPATKEQRELLLSKIKDEGYTWNAEKLELEILDK